MGSTMPLYIDTPTVVAIVASTALIYISLSSLPNWARLWSRKDKPKDCKDANDDLANPVAIINKLREMMALVTKVSDEATPDELTNWQMAAGFYSLLHLNTELWALDPDYREKMYDKDDDVKLDELKELKDALEYADWAYETCFATLSANCRKVGLDLLHHDTATEPGRVSHFIALDHKNKTAIIGLKGTSTLADALTDLIATPKEHCCHFDAPETARGLDSNNLFCHEGIHTAALWMADDIADTVENVFLPLGYKLLICGHSLGAGTACLLGMELRARIAAYRKNFTDLRVLAFATPAVLSFKASKECAPFITSVVNNSDLVPRASIGNLLVMNKLVLKVNERLDAKGHKLDTWAALRKYYEEEVAKVDDDLLFSAKELEDFFNETHCDPEVEGKDHLFVPGRCVVLWDKGENDNHEVGGIVTDCEMKMLRQIELSSTMVTDHLCGSYRDNMVKLIQQLEKIV
ncbi:hypothetical protein ACHAWO_009570 [Cyclotella atomus]|uniref:sn-1-specific diacylglycerol lipase n=1 Tax=Cyclotella atomus TaxID=382360 RepID=A0ABD3N7L3_9STRA